MILENIIHDTSDEKIGIIRLLLIYELNIGSMRFISWEWTGYGDLTGKFTLEIRFDLEITKCRRLVVGSVQVGR